MDAKKNIDANRRVVQLLRLSADIFDEILSIQSSTLPSAIFLAVRRMNALALDCIKQSDVAYDDQYLTLEAVRHLYVRRVLNVSRTQEDACKKLAIGRTQLWRIRKLLQKRGAR